MNIPINNFTIYFDGIFVIKLDDGNYYPLNISLSDLILLFENEGYSREVISKIAEKKGGFLFTKTPVFKDLFIDDAEDLFYTPSFFTNNQFIAVHLDFPTYYETIYIDRKRTPIMKKDLLIKNEKDFLKFIYTHQMPKYISFPEDFGNKEMKDMVDFCKSWIYTVSFNREIAQPKFLYHK